MTIALWRQVEAMAPQQRLDFLMDTPDVFAAITMALPGQAERPHAICRHTDVYIRARRSFTQSKEWKEFRLKFLETHTACEKCGATEHLQVHHAGCYTVDHTVIQLGLTWVFDYPQCLEVMCQECHYQMHRTLIEHERKPKVRKSWLQRLLGR